ncbi:hypothetical protein [Arhodomonas sp. AD133]|uniref:hypothetical protein n=1 Tax=Arhodomonas sp. AD133 TaxID=3415009 RepID=UPI003EBD2FB1
MWERLLTSIKKPRIGAEPSDSQAFLEITEALLSSFLIIAFEAKVGSSRDVPGSIRQQVASDLRKENNLLGERFILFEESFVRGG